MDLNEFSYRRNQLLGMMGEDSIAILPTANIHYRNRDATFPFRADSNFYYLTGFPEPEAVAVLIPERDQGEYILFCRERDPERETWDGRRAGIEGACEIYRADDAFPISDIDDILPGLLEGKVHIYYAIGHDQDFDQRITAWINQLRKATRSGMQAPMELIILDNLLHEMRLFKSNEEINTIRTAVRISAEAHIHAMQVCHPNIMEYEIEAGFLHHFFRQGCKAPAYSSIVAGGNNACILHYTDNNTSLQSGDLLLIDAGAEYDYYAADITRTFPINGRFSPAQKTIYELVLKAQLAAIDKVRPGNHWNDPHEAAVQVLTEGLVAIGLLRGEVNILIETEAYRKFYMHRTGHWLGMDVHDVGDYKIDGQWRSFEPGMVLTVEPGLYIPENCPEVGSQWWGIGIRIEDDILVTSQGCEVLTAAVPKTVDEIQNIVGTS
ncbi:Xaa-Pro aminopeptidase [Candidatus Nitrosacidococcus tergens]|uniref:Xaa-Pro aminopeptidase n=1 Tax=Candidatus Nitrosacidococcus tergens TaxID=553981 RepID=A0A7G1Q7R6_9GAMM|nr:Xaa-Pro aminopeptidase [Candidatus Nitrosacidococcus tergens]CAB1274542.1 proline aminopeptidase P II [Candidatus Nitrosacidococcus tergens]